MNIYEIEKQATPGPLLRLTNPLFDGTGKDTVSYAHLCSTHRSAAPLAVLALADISIEEAAANAELTRHCCNHFMRALEAYKRLVQDARDKGCLCLFGEDHDALIAELEEVK